jgi:hexosaminidase
MLFPAPTRLFLMAALFLSAVSCKDSKDAHGTDALIPRPMEAMAGKGSFWIDRKTSIQIAGSNAETARLGWHLSSALVAATGFELPVAAAEGDSTGRILLTLDEADTTLGGEGYVLDVTEQQASIRAHAPAGIFYGIQTLRQLLPAKIESEDSVKQVSWEIPAVHIRDRPEYAYRGSMLDVARHFFGVDDVKRYIDLISTYKMNILHLHLTDDQGWRIEIKSRPRLTEVGGSTQVGGGKGGFYTQEQYADIVHYAAERFVTVIPEVDMPGHTNAAIVSYPWLNCRDTVHTLYTGIEVGFSTFCAKNDSTYALIDDVVREIAALTPGPWIHIGGDESHVTLPEDYVTFVNRVQPIVTKYGKKVIGWDEIANADLQPNTTVQFWADVPNTQMAVKKGAQVIMSPAKKVYLDMQYDSTTRLGLHWAAYIEVDDAYNWDPASYTEGVARKDILGVEAPLWTETILNMEDIEYMVFPRLPGIAEIGWTGGAGRQWEEYRERLAKHGRHLKAMGVNFYPSKKVDWK